MISFLEVWTKIQFSQFQIFLGKILFFGFSCCSTHQDISIDVSITNVRLILRKAWVISSLGVQTDRHGIGILLWKHVCTQKISTQSSKLVVSCRFSYDSPENGDAQQGNEENLRKKFENAIISKILQI